nr:AAA family ATPase [Mycobacterium lepromatosis]
MADAKQTLTEAVLWSLQHSDNFTRLNVDPPHDVLLYGPPDCGKTLVVRRVSQHRAVERAGRHRLGADGQVGQQLEKRSGNCSGGSTTLCRR